MVETCEVSCTRVQLHPARVDGLFAILPNVHEEPNTPGRWLFDVGPEQETRKPDLDYVNDVQEGLAHAYDVATRHALDNARRNNHRYDKRVRP